MPRSSLSAIETACREFVAFKDALDASLVSGERLRRAGIVTPMLGQQLAGIRPNGHDRHRVSAITPDRFVQWALPFTDTVPIKADYAPAAIDPTLIISGTYNDYDTSILGRIHPDRVMDFSDGLVTDYPTDPYASPETPRVGQIGSLPLYVAFEGKNRVALFKRYRTVMHVFVRPLFFPPADQLRLIPLRPFGHHALAHGKPWAFLPFDRVVIPLLVAYGVALDRPQVLWRSWAGVRRQRCAIVSSQMAR